MRAFTGARRALAKLSVRAAAAEEAASTPAQLSHAAAFSSGMLRGRPAPASWSLELNRVGAHANIASTTSSLAASQAWTASVVHTESSQVEEWLAAMHSVDADARSVCTGLLTRRPELLWTDAVRVTGVVQALVDATRQRHLLRPYFMQDAHILALVDRYTPESLRARLAELHRLVWQKLDDSNVAALFSSRTSLDMLDLDAKALALKAQALRALIPEFLPSTVLRGCPELLDVQVDDLPHHVRRAGDVVVVGPNVDVELVGPNNVVIVRSRAASPPSPSASQPSSTAATAGRLLRSARCGAQQLLQEQARTELGTFLSGREVTRVFCNTRQLVGAWHEQVDVRVEDPLKAQEDLSAACRAAVLQHLAAASQASAVGARA